MFVRTDIPLADQMVQVAHACLEAGFKYQRPSEMVNMVVLSVDTENHLLSSIERLGLRGIQCVVFLEPDDHMGFTAACTEPLTAAYRHEFRSFPLWRPPREAIKT